MKLVVLCDCGNHARYLVLDGVADVVCSLCAMKSPHRTVRISDATGASDALAGFLDLTLPTVWMKVDDLVKQAGKG